MEVLDIIKDWLKEHGCDGLCGEECGCLLDDLMPCGEGSTECQAGYKWMCDICQLEECQGKTENHLEELWCIRPYKQPVPEPTPQPVNQSSMV